MDDRGSQSTWATRQGLQHKVARYIAFAVVMSIVGSALVMTILRHLSVREVMEDSARTYSSLVNLPIVHAATLYASTGRHILRERIDHWRSLNQDVVTLEVFDVQGRLLMRADGEGVMTQSPGDSASTIGDQNLLQAVRGLDVTAQRVKAADGRVQFRVVAPAVEEWGRHTYTLVASFSYQRVRRERTSSALWMLFHVAVGLVFAQWVSVVLARSITRNLRQLHEGARRIQNGELGERVDVSSEDEIGELAEAFNAMADKLLETIEQLREANRELESLDQAKADLVANVSHELKTPLTALRGYLELMAQGSLGELGADADRAVEVCQKNVERLSVRIEELVQLSQLERSMTPVLKLERVHLDDLLHGVVETLLPRLEEKKIVCSLNLATDLPGLRVSHEHVERVFLNILDNAIKFSAPGGAIRVSAEPFRRDHRDGVLVRVADTGMGIPAKELLRIFDRFYQVDPSTRRRYGGMGLGLALVRSIVEAHRGMVWAESQKGQGSTFFVWLPCSGPDSSSSHPVSSAKLSDVVQPLDMQETKA